MPAATTTPVDGHASQETLAALIRERVDSGRSSGIVVGVVDNGGLRVAAYGDPGPGQPGLDSLTVFEIGSLTKVFTATLLSKLALRGEVSLSDPISDFLPKWVPTPHQGSREIQLLDLATHTSGLPRLPTNLRSIDPLDPLAGYTEDDLYDYIAHLELTRGIGLEYEYSNTGFGLLGHALSLKAGLDYGHLLREHIFEPLGMAMTSTRLDPYLKRRFALPHDERGRVVGTMEFGALAGAGAMVSNASDLLTFASANLFSTGDLLHRAMQESHQPRHEAASGQRVGLGWHLAKRLDREFVWHSGETVGSRSFIGLDKPGSRAAVVLSNSIAAIEDIGFHVLDQRNALMAERPEITLAPETLRQYVGTYEMPAGGSVVVTMADGGLFAEASGLGAAALHAASEADFYVKAIPVDISFQRDRNGQVSQLVLTFGGESTTAYRAIAGK